jgi:hypothetical protein
MIHNILQVIAKDLNTFLQMRFQYSEDIVVLSELMNNADGSFAVAGGNQMVCTLMNVEQERLHANSPMGTKAMFNPPFNLNLYVLFSAFYTPANYIEGLKALSFTIGFFQSKPVFTPANTPDLEPGVEKITVELSTTGMEEQSSMWAAIGAKHLPCALFKIRMLSITAEGMLENPVRSSVKVEQN